MRFLRLLSCIPLAAAVPGIAACAAQAPVIERAAVLRPWLDAGPMIGHVSDTEAVVWLRTAGDQNVQADAQQEGAAGPRSTRVEDLGDGCHKVWIDGLIADAPVSLTLRVEDSDPLTISFPAGPAPSKTGMLRIAFGSCAKIAEFGDAPVYSAMAAENPDLTLFVGDNCYYVRGELDPDHYDSTGGDVGDWIRSDLMLARQMQTRSLKELDPLLRIAPCYATWDDHDFGPNNTGAEFEGKDRALRVFQQVWANKSFGTDAVPGVFSSFRRGPVEVFLMDNRYYRRPPQDVGPELAVIWGDDQLAWLERGLLASDAPVKIIANGTQVLSKGKSDDNHWRDARREYFKLLDILSEVHGAVIVLSGDRHFSELMCLEVPGQRPLYEFTSSPIQQGREMGRKKGDKNTTRLFAMDGNSYGLVTIDVQEDDGGAITFECRDEQNQVPVIKGDVMKLQVPLAELLVATEGDSK